MGSDNPKWREKIELTFEEHIRNQQSRVIELARELEEEIGKNKTLEIIGQLYEKKEVKSVKELLHEKPINSMDDFIAFHEDVLRKRRAYSFEMELIKPSKLVVHTTSCIYAKVCRELDAVELGYTMNCATDFALAQVFNPNLRLERTMTLMQGDPYCNFEWIWEEE